MFTYQHEPYPEPLEIQSTVCTSVKPKWSRMIRLKFYANLSSHLELQNYGCTYLEFARATG